MVYIVSIHHECASTHDKTGREPRKKSSNITMSSSGFRIIAYIGSQPRLYVRQYVRMYYRIFAAQASCIHLNRFGGLRCNIFCGASVLHLPESRPRNERSDV